MHFGQANCAACRQFRQTKCNDNMSTCFHGRTRSSITKRACGTRVLMRAGAHGSCRRDAVASTHTRCAAGWLSLLCMYKSCQSANAGRGQLSKKCTSFILTPRLLPSRNLHRASACAIMHSCQGTACNHAVVVRLRAGTDTDGEAPRAKWRFSLRSQKHSIPRRQFAAQRT